MDDIEFTRRWDAETKGKPTFAGVLIKHWDRVSKAWKAASTQKTYISDYENYILSELQDHPLEEYSREDFDRIVESIPRKKASEGRVCNEQTIRHIKHIIRRVLEVAEEVHVCKDVLWGSDYVLSETAEEEKLCQEEYVKLRKSFTIHEEISIANRILCDPNQEAEKFGLALMFCLGLRNNEACGADFGDINPLDCDPSIQTLWVYKSTEKGTNSQRFSGKTNNVSRIVPLPTKLSDLLQKRRALLEEHIASSAIPEGISKEEYIKTEVDAMPIVGLGPDFDERCSAPILTSAGTTLLKEIKFEQEQLALIDRDIRMPGRTEEGIAEKDPTAYLFRRNLGTHLYLLGLEESEIQYIIGHEIEDASDERSFFRNEEKLYPIAQKMSLRPVVNTITSMPETTMGSYYSHHDVNKEQLNINVEKKARYRLFIRQREPFSDLQIKLKPGSIGMSGHYTAFPCDEPFSETLSITNEYLTRYQKALDKKA